jgi:hypothetical protein
MSKDKEEQIRRLYEEAAYWHLVHTGMKIRRDEAKLHEDNDT